ncbi:unnamed protein product [Schistosoma curassoni]|uniref:Uncharacterized protein n=1 Tax=Schistosoma curassoni TaxID=6186 RepID=A0A183JEH5_9TREM|nr:unnamed protein product [Schistosoma curassoni]
MVVEGSQQETLDLGFVLLGTRQQSLPIAMRGLKLLDRFDSMSSTFTVRDVTTRLSGLRLTSCSDESIISTSQPVSEHQFHQDYKYTLLTSAK